jgi:di/tricarboxylate transporter
MEIATVQMAAVFALIVVSLVLYASEKLPLEVTSLGVLCALMVLFQVLPADGAQGVNRLDAVRLLSGFANPALIAVLGLLVIGDALERTGALDKGAALVLAAGRGSPVATVTMALSAVLVVSAVLNNIPVVVIFIPIMQAISLSIGRRPSRLLIPLSFAAMLGGMTTLIGSSTNLLVSSALVQLGERPFGFFDFTIPGIVLASVGLVYLLAIAPRLLPDHSDMAQSLAPDNRQFIAQITVAEGAALDGAGFSDGAPAELADLGLLLVQREEHAFLPPFDGVTLQAGDVIVVGASREALAQAVKSDPVALHPRFEGEVESPERWLIGGQVLAEIMVTPGSTMIGRTLEDIGFRYKHHCIVIGIQRRSQLLRRRLTEIRLEAGDTLLVQGRRDDIRALRGNHDAVLMEWSAEDIPAVHHARRAGLIFFAVVAASATGLLPISIAALSGAVAMVATGVMGVRDAMRALDRQLVFLIAAALALGAALQETGGADFLADTMLAAVGNASHAVVLSVFFTLVALLSNVLSTKATAVLFTPIAVGVAHSIGAPVEPFAVAVVFAANCSFASPVGYQTNLLVMGPGGYRFFDFVRVGMPLIVLLWITFSLFAPWYYGL